MAMGDTPLTVVGNLTSDPELKFTAGGSAMIKFTIASTPRHFDREAGQYKDGTAMFLRCTAWRQLAEHVAASVGKGARVVVTGRLRQFEWQTDQGENRSMLALEVDDIGPSLRFATAAPNKHTTSNGTNSGSTGGDAWNTPAGSTETPF